MQTFDVFFLILYSQKQVCFLKSLIDNYTYPALNVRPSADTARDAKALKMKRSNIQWEENE